ncbi:MAG: oligopeptide ABC transporter permease OppB [Candidatus Symbiodolus clandestinus]
MLSFAVRRFLQAIPTLLVLSSLAFFVMRLAPGNPFSDERAFPKQILANIEAKYGLDAPLYQQYGRYMKNLLKGDLGPSFRYRDFSVNDLVEQAFPVSMRIGLWAFGVAVILGISIGVLAALKQNSWVDHWLMLFAMIGVVIPNFIKAPLMILIFAVEFQWFPPGGWCNGSWENLVLPVTALAISYVSRIARLTRSSMIEVLHTNFIRTAKAKGLPMYYIAWKHALRPALLPVMAYLGPVFVGVITGSVVIETVFGLPGLGRHFVNGAMNRDYSLVLSLTVIVGTLTTLFTAVVDILSAWIDPRIRY